MAAAVKAATAESTVTSTVSPFFFKSGTSDEINVKHRADQATAPFPGSTRCFLIPMIPNFGEKVNRKGRKAHKFIEQKQIKKAELSLCLF